MKSIPIIALVLGLGLSGPAMAGGMASDPETGNLNTELLVAQCVVCHGQGGDSVSSTPKLTGMREIQIISKMKGYRDGTLAGTIMPRFTKGFTDAQINVIAANLASN